MIEKGKDQLGADARQKGFNWIMRHANQIYKSDDKFIGITFRQHPFDLPMFKHPRSNDRELPIKYLKLGGTFLVVDNMPVLIARELAFHLSNKDERLITGLRVIYGQCDLARPKHHDLYYEVATKNNVYMVEGATDCSGHGGSCKEHLDAMFALLADMWDVKIETVEIPYHQAEMANNKIKLALWNHHKLM